MNNRQTGAFISERRRELSLSQKQVAEKLNVTDKAVSKWETGRSAPDISLLIPLADLLGVTVVEILKGEKMQERKLSDASNEIIVKTIKKTRVKVAAAVAIVIILAGLLASAYPAYHYFTSVPVNDEAAIERMANGYFRTSSDAKDMKIIKSLNKGGYYAFILQSEDETKMRLFETDDVFKDRISVCGGSGALSPGKIDTYCVGISDKVIININIFSGYDMSISEYSFTYRGVEYTCPVEGEVLLDMFIDVDNSFTNASLDDEYLK